MTTEETTEAVEETPEVKCSCGATMQRARKGAMWCPACGATKGVDDELTDPPAPVEDEPAEQIFGDGHDGELMTDRSYKTEPVEPLRNREPPMGRLTPARPVVATSVGPAGKAVDLEDERELTTATSIGDDSNTDAVEDETEDDG